MHPNGSYATPCGKGGGLHSEESKDGTIYRTAIFQLIATVFYRYLPTMSEPK